MVERYRGMRGELEGWGLTIGQLGSDYKNEVGQKVKWSDNIGENSGTEIYLQD